MSRRIATVVALIILTLMLRTLLIGAAEDSATTDEVPHIAAGYTYVQTRDYRLNPEHPPLVKDLVGLSLSTMKLNYPYDYFYANVRGQYDNGYRFLYQKGNDANEMLLRARIPIIAITLILGLAVFRWSSKLNGYGAGLFSLLLFAFDPNILAHGRLVTQDIAISAVVVVNLYFVWKFLRRPTTLNLIPAGLTLGVALVTKFSAPLLLVTYFALFVYLSVKGDPENETTTRGEHGNETAATSALVPARWEIGLRYLRSFAWMGLIAAAIVHVVYTLNMLEMPISVQTRLIQEYLPTKAPVAALISQLGLRPLAHYMLGFEMVGNHVAAGQPVFLLGELSHGTRYYYLLAFAVKSTIPMMILLALALIFGRKIRSGSSLAEVALIVAALSFPIAASLGSLDLGIRYILPLYPLFYIYAGKLVKLFRIDAFGRHFGGRRFRPGGALLNVALPSLVVWQIATCAAISPHHLSYFNELVGPAKGARIISDSNVDWGQDLTRLKKYADDKRIDRISIDYFGGGSVEYYFGKRAVNWWSDKKGRPRGWFAISVNNYTRAVAQGHYGWLKDYRPVDRIGYSILVYKLP